MPSIPVRLLLGFLAAAIAVVTVHQSIVFLLDASGLITRQAWSTAPHGPLQVPTIVNSTFWGGLWGALLGLIYDRFPGRSAWLKGLLFGWMMYIVSNSTLLPLIKGQPLFFDFQWNQALAVFLILSGFGMATAILYDWLRQRFA